MLDAADTAMMMLGAAGGGHMSMAGVFPLKRFWRVSANYVLLTRVMSHRNVTHMY